VGRPRLEASASVVRPWAPCTVPKRWERCEAAPAARASLRAPAFPKPSRERGGSTWRARAVSVAHESEELVRARPCGHVEPDVRDG
jgi:hypothetical protein